MSESLTREMGLLRTIVAYLEKRPLPFTALTQEMLRQKGLGHVREQRGSALAIRIPGHHAFTKLTDCLLDRLPRMERGIRYSDIQTELFNFIEYYVDRLPSSVGEQDIEALVAHFEKWFADMALLRHVFVPCVISRISAPRFEIGPVTFEFVDCVATSNFYPKNDAVAATDRLEFDRLLQWMREQNADWLARVSVDGCDSTRAEEVAEIAVDLTIVGLQLAAPYLDTRTMARLDARRGTLQKRTLSEANGNYTVGWTRKEPGMSIGQGTLSSILEKAEPIFVAIGNVVRSFASGSFRLPGLERAWCDAAYWFHQALAESIDTIAIAKLETALEILLRTESSKGSERRILEILKTIFGLEPDDLSAPGSTMTVRQFARNIVRDRSRILHGTWSTLNARGMNRAGMEGFVTSVLRITIVELEAYLKF